MMNQSTYKHLKEEFVSNLSGTSMPEIAVLSFLFPAFLLLCKCHRVLFKTEIDKKAGARTHCLWSLIVDFTLIVVPTLSILTILNGKVYMLTATALLYGLVLAFFIGRRQVKAGHILSKDKQQAELPQLQFLSSHRFVVMLVTCLSILAVDFNIFPRRYAKTETYGTGLMDVGVGSFVVVNALVSRKARGLSTLEGSGHVLPIAPLLLLGLARLLSTKQVDYQVHVGEYGVHWNFFFTLAAVAFLTSLINIPTHLSGIFGAAILLVYQLCLLSGLNDYLNSTQRGVSLYSQNKEGIFSLLGYWGLYLLSVQLGHFFFKSRKSKKFESGLSKLMGVAGIWALAILFWLLTILSNRFIERTSRRSCNMTYALFILAVNLEGLGVLVFSEVLPNMKPLLIERIFTENMLATFLLANVLTGLINLSVNTIFSSGSVAYAILVLYSLTLVAGMAVLRILNVKIKL